MGCVCKNWIEMSQGRDKGRFVVKKTENVRVHKM